MHNERIQSGASLDSEQLGVRCLAQGHLSSGPGGELAPLQYQSTLRTPWSDRDVNRRPFGPKSLSVQTEPLPPVQKSDLVKINV